MVQQKSFEFTGDNRRALLGLPLSASAKLAMVMLDEISNGDDFCCPSLNSLSELMGCSEHVAREAIREAERAGFLEVDRLPWKTSAYRIDWSTIQPIEREAFNVNRYL